jgi:hypothetical protein
VVPLLVTAFLHHYNLDEKIGKLAQYATSFPSESWLRTNIMDQAAHEVVQLATELDGQFVFLACDKGNKKGVEHLVKYLSWVDDEGKVWKQLLDLDGSQSTTKAVAFAIKASLSKLNILGRTLVLKGQTTDSGCGGGVLDGLAAELLLLGVTVEQGDYLVAAFSIHCLQLQLSNPTKACIGERGVDKGNAMQTLHNIWDLQNLLD